MHVRGRPLPPIYRNGVAIADRNGGSTQVIITIPALPTNLGLTPGSALQAYLNTNNYQNAAYSVFTADGWKAVRAHPDDRDEDVDVTVWWASTAPSGNCLATSGITWNLGQPANGQRVKCIKVEGIEIPKKHEAHIHLSLEFALKNVDNWPATAQTAFRAGFAFKSTTTVQLDSDFPIAALRDAKYVGNDAAGLTFAGQKVTAVGGFLFDTNGAGIGGATVKLFDTAPTPGTACTATPRSSYVTDPDGFYFIFKNGLNTMASSGANDLPSGLKYYLAVCDASAGNPPTAVPNAYLPARYIDHKLGNKEFDEEDFYISNPTHIAFSTEPVPGNRANRTMYTVQVAVLDAWNNVVDDDSTVITLSHSNGPGTLTGTLTRTMSNGYATFSDLKISASGSGNTLTATDTTSGGSPPHPFASTTSQNFTISP